MEIIHIIYHGHDFSFHKITAVFFSHSSLPLIISESSYQVTFLIHTLNILFIMFDHIRFFYVFFGICSIIHLTLAHKSGTIKNVGAFCANDTSIGEPNLIPIDETPARLIAKVENGTLYQIGSGEDQVWLAHVYGENGYDYGFAYGTLLKDQIHKMVPRAWAHFEQEIIDALKDLKLPKWFEDLVADKGLGFALDVQNDLVRNYMDEEIYNEMRGISDASQMDYKTVVRLHMLGEITRGKHLSFSLFEKKKEICVIYFS